METLTKRILPFAFFAVISAGFLYFAFKAYRQTWMWWEIPATLVSSEVRPTRTDNGSGYVVVAKYTYAVGAKEYTGDGVRLNGNFFASQQAAETYLGSLKRRQPLIAHVNPNNPDEAMLDPSSSWWMPAIPGALIAGLALITLWKDVPERSSYDRHLD